MILVKVVTVLWQFFWQDTCDSFCDFFWQRYLWQFCDRFLKDKDLSYFFVDKDWIRWYIYFIESLKVKDYMLKYFADMDSDKTTFCLSYKTHLLLIVVLIVWNIWVGYNLISNQLLSFVKTIFVLKNWGNGDWSINDSDSYDECNYKVTIFFYVKM